MSSLRDSDSLWFTGSINILPLSGQEENKSFRFYPILMDNPFRDEIFIDNEILNK